MTDNPRKQTLIVPPGQGRSYKMGGMSSLFLADGAETSNEYSISEWWLDPHQSGSGPHSHEENDDIFYVLEGTVTFILNGVSQDAPKGTFLRVPTGVVHDFENRTHSRAGFLNFYIPGNFEKDMPAIVQWFEENG